MHIDILRPEMTEAYNHYLTEHGNSLFSHSSKYKDFLKDLLECEEEYLLVLEGGKIRGLLPLMLTNSEKGRVFNSLPYYGSIGGILADTPEAYEKLVEAYNEIACSATTLSSTIISNPFLPQSVCGINHNYKDYRIAQSTNIAFQYNHQDELVSRIDSSARRNIRKAISEGVIVEIDPTQMERLREMHQENMRALGGLPKTNKFFELVPKHFKPGQDFDLYVAKKDGLVIAALLIFYFNLTVEYFTPAIDSQFRSIQPLSLILITAMTDASRRGLACWHWQGTWASQQGVYRFKKKWAAIEQRYNYYTQLNDGSILNWTQTEILNRFPSFFVVPFSALNGRSNI